jgi:hypothetical protein
MRNSLSLNYQRADHNFLWFNYVLLTFIVNSRLSIHAVAQESNGSCCSRTNLYQRSRSTWSTCKVTKVLRD